MSDDKVQASYQRMRSDLVKQWIIDAQEDPRVLEHMVISAVCRLSNKDVARFWTKANNMEKRNEKSRYAMQRA